MSTHRSRPHPLGVHPRAGGVDVAIFAAHAEQVDLCLFDPVGSDWSERRITLPDQTYGVWHAHVPDVPVGQRYGLRVHGPWDPSRTQWHNPAKLLLDPYARAIALPTSGAYPGERLTMVPELFGYAVDGGLRGDVTVPDERDSALVAPHGVVEASTFDWEGDAPPFVPWTDTVVYEVHVKGFTRLMPGVPEHLRGTYAGLGHPAAIAHLNRLGVTTVELLPIHAMGDEDHLARGSRVNYWGYSTLGFFAPHPGYAASHDPIGVVTEFKAMVKALHAAGIEVVLDVVYNHTCEAGIDGPTLSWRGLDAASYYRTDAHGSYVDTTGCGNSLDFTEARVVQLTLDSLRYWVGEMHVDGFRFDLATTLARGRDGYDADHPFLVAARTDPVLAGVKLIAEPWDVAPHGWRTGQFPMPFGEWNDHFRDDVREFWLPGGARAAAGEPSGGIRDLATRLAGSADTFTPARGPLASVNFVTAHDGFTVADLTAYNHKHNEANGENNRDGTDNNRSWNHGVEGPTDDPAILAARRLAMRNLLGSLLLATGVPMLVAGDEVGRSQGGNNNPYCLDDETSWFNWDLDPWQNDLLATTRYLLRLRREHPVLRQDRFFAGRPVHADGTKDLAWFGPDGTEMDHDRWHDSGLRVLQMYLHAVVRGRHDHHVDGSLLIVVQGYPREVEVRLPGRPWAQTYELAWDSAFEAPPGQPHGPRLDSVPPHTTLTVPGPSMRVYRVPPRT
ncbi:MAG: glycogen debranching protein GlgX [Kineosporiaceae bacterium]|nr:glycogen debranching protein GlgX [Kineosporiaceae bacterium]